MWVNERASRAIKLVLNCEYLHILPAKYLFDKMERAKKNPSIHLLIFELAFENVIVSLHVRLCV